MTPFQIGAGALAAGLLSSTGPPVVTVAVAAVLGGALLLHPRLAALAVLHVLLGGVVGDARLRALDAPVARVRDSRVDGLRVLLLSSPRPNPFGASAAVGVVSGRQPRPASDAYEEPHAAQRARHDPHRRGRPERVGPER